MSLKRIVCTITGFLFIFFCYTGCISGITYTGDFDLDDESEIHNLQYVNITNEESFEKADYIFTKTFTAKTIRHESQEYGYFCIEADTGLYCWGDSLWYMPYILTLGLATPFILVGSPTDSAYLYADLTVYVFDSNGDFVEKFHSNKQKYVIAGLFYNKNPNADKLMKKAAIEVQDDIGLKAYEINKKLEASGANSPEKEEKALSEIKKYLKQIENSKRNNSSSSYYVPSSTQSYSNSSQSTTASPSLQLKNGTYTCSGTNIKMTLNMGTVTLKEGYSSIGMGTYSVQGNRVIFSFSYAINDAAALNGKTVAYSIQDETCFSGSGETWVYTGWN